jgi:putative membrane protein
MSIPVLQRDLGLVFAQAEQKSTTILSLPDHFLGDMVSAFCFGLLAILLVVVGFKVFDWLTPRCNFQDEINKGNISAGIIIGSVIIGICYVIAHVLVGIIQVR